MNVFPNTDAYLIIGDPGVGTVFIKNLVANFYYNIDLVISERGDTHGTSFHENISKLSGRIASDTHNMDKELIYEPEDESLPFIIRSHNQHFNLMPWLKKFPKGKVIVIKTHPKYFKRMVLNIFVKNFIASLDMTNINNGAAQQQLRWAAFVKEFPFLKGKTKESEISLKEYKIMLQNREQLYQEKKRHFRFPHNSYFGIQLKSNQILNLFYDDILNNMDKVLNDLSLFTGKPITKNAHENYQNYLQAQDILINKYAPWLINEEKLK